MTWQRAWHLSEGEEIRGLDALDDTGLRVAVTLDPPFVAPADGWYVCTYHEGRTTFAPSERPSGIPARHFAGTEAAPPIEIHSPPHVWPDSDAPVDVAERAREFVANLRPTSEEES